MAHCAYLLIQNCHRDSMILLGINQYGIRTIEAFFGAVKLWG